MKTVIEKIKNTLLNHQWTIVFLLALPYINDTYPSHYYIYFWIRDYFKIISLLLITLILFMKKKKISRLTMILLLSQGVLLISTILNYPFSETEVYDKMFYDILSFIFMAFLVECYEDQISELFNGLLLNYEMALYPCYVGMLMNIPEEGYYVRGLMNTLILWILPALFIAILHMLLDKKYARSALMIVVCILMSIRVWSATCIVALLGIVFLSGMGFLFYKKDLKISALLVLILAVVANAFVLFFYSGGHFGPLDLFIEKFLGRSVDFTQRTVIWEEVIRMIKEKPVLGHGSRPLVYATNDFSSVFIHAHNALLQRLNESGVIGMFLFIAFHIELVRKLDQDENTIFRIASLSFLFGIWLTYITEAYKDSYLFYIVFYISYFIGEDGLKNKKDPQIENR